MDMDMNIGLHSVLFGLGGKCLLNWALILLQKSHIWRSFICVFSLSLAFVDTVLTLIVTFIHLQSDANILGWRVTQYHFCLLVQTLGYIYSAQHYSLLIITSLEHLYIVLRRLQHSIWKPTWLFQLFLTICVWVFSTFFVFKISTVRPYLEDVAHFQINQCWISSSSVISELAIFLSCLSLLWVLWDLLTSLIHLAKNPHSDYLTILKNQIQPKLLFVCKVGRIFWDVWALFLLFLFFHTVTPVKMPSHLGLNCAWLCFVNSVLVAVALSVVRPASELTQNLAAVPPDSFCDWKTEFSLANQMRYVSKAREGNNGENTARSNVTNNGIYYNY